MKQFQVQTPPVRGVPILCSCSIPNQFRSQTSRVGLTQKTQSRASRKQLGICCSFGVDGLSDSVSPMIQSVSTMLSSFSFFLGLIFLGRQVLTPRSDEYENQDPCARCNGTGLEPCFCTRWSDGDVGCPSCEHTGYTRCKACGGTGKAVPLSIYVDKDDPRGY